ncbi:hypothetical protein F3Y22_tig00010968pilonHSYRG00073 [Hibiscus syriacus]|uniref:Uncharacterized protein n=1 Tax=Hibiscus syriacus TaxID=106335 RepID=A0A6A3CA42_HIBSY|nr:hypothetical protein F3Y22_tig00010968pilonHSYRG00073 [Hibiscus syriacus]
MELENICYRSFRRDHYCEDEACLANKFIVFRSVAEQKRHNTIEHGGLMSLAQLIMMPFSTNEPTSSRPMEASSTNIAAASSVVTGNAVAQMSNVSSSHAQTRTQSATARMLITPSSQTSSDKASRIATLRQLHLAGRHKKSSSGRILRIVEDLKVEYSSLKI